MSMPISVDIPGQPGSGIFDEVFDLFRQIDSDFSTYKPESEVSRYQRGELALEDASHDFRAVFAACEEYAAATQGYFSAYFSGTFDPTGYVKGWAIARAARFLQDAGTPAFMINAGGDVYVHSTTGRVWNVGLEHPSDKQALAGTIQIQNGAVATSGTYARGQHIIDPHSGQPADSFLSVTVTGPDIVAADVFATTVFAMGRKGLDFITRQPGYQVLCIYPTLEVVRAGAAANTQNAQ
ncbi:MAG TPA: FAD:protein FMN transferase [Patescibacteria group bacterium]|nr:FAD:protein FMN transferase [Patescibacteria group bacterium]